MILIYFWPIISNKAISCLHQLEKKIFFFPPLKAPYNSYDDPLLL